MNLKGFQSTATEVDKKRVKFRRPKGPKGTLVTDEMWDTALEEVQNHPHVHNARHTSSGEILATPKHYRSISKTNKVLEQFSQRLFQVIVNAIIAVSRKAKGKLRQASATQREEARRFLNDKTRTAPSPFPAS